MSHLTTPRSIIVNDKATIEYSSADRDLRRRYIVTQFGGYAVLAASMYFLILNIARNDWIGIIAIMVVGIAVISYSTKVGEIHHDYQPAKHRRLFTRKVFGLVHQHFSVAKASWSSRASYSIDIEMLDTKVKLMRLKLTPKEDPMLRAHVYEISPTSIVAVRGPKFEDIYPDLKVMLEQDDDFGEADKRIADTFIDRLDASSFEPLYRTGLVGD